MSRDSKSFHEILKKTMEETNTTQSKLADYTGMTRQAISLYSTGRSVPDIITLINLADYFNVSTDYLLGRVTKEDCMTTVELTAERNTLKYEIGRLRKAVNSINEILETY